MSTKKFRKISHSEQEISKDLSYYSKETIQLKDWQTYKNLKLFGNGVQTSQECLEKLSERYLIQNRRYPYIGLNFSKELSQLTDWQTYQNLNFLANSVQTFQECLKKIQKDILSRTGDIPIFV